MKMIWTRVKRIFSVDDNVIEVTKISNILLKSYCNKSFDVAIKIIDSIIVNLYQNMNKVNRFILSLQRLIIDIFTFLMSTFELL